MENNNRSLFSKYRRFSRLKKLPFSPKKWLRRGSYLLRTFAMTRVAFKVCYEILMFERGGLKTATWRADLNSGLFGTLNILRMNIRIIFANLFEMETLLFTYENFYDPFCELQSLKIDLLRLELLCEFEFWTTYHRQASTFAAFYKEKKRKEIKIPVYVLTFGKVWIWNCEGWKTSKRRK